MTCKQCEMLSANYPLARCIQHSKEYYIGMAHAYNNISDLLADEKTTRKIIRKYIDNEQNRIDLWFKKSNVNKNL